MHQSMSHQSEGECLGTSRFKVLGTYWVLEEFCSYKQNGKPGLKVRCSPAQLYLREKIEDDREPSEAKPASPRSALLSEARSRPGRGAGQLKVTLSGTRIGV